MALMASSHTVPVNCQSKGVMTLKPPQRKVHLIGLDYIRDKDPRVPLGLGSIATHLATHGIPCEAHSFAVNRPIFSTDAVVQHILERGDKDTLLCLPAFIWGERQLQEILMQLRGHGYPGTVVLGGPQVTYTTPSGGHRLEQLYPGVDVFVRGYGEEAVAQLALAEALDQQFSSTDMTRHGIHIAGQQDLGAVAQVDLQLLESPLLAGTIQPSNFLRWETQRGCPFRCAFCQHREGDNSFGRRRRNFGPSRVLQEAEWICSHPTVKDISVVDPIFNVGPQYMQVLEVLAAGGYQGRLSLQCRFELITPQFLQALATLPARVTLEFGLQTVQQDEAKMIQRPNDMLKVAAVMQQLKEFGIDYEISLIFGLPGQTLQSFKDSITFCQRLGVPRLRAWPLMLLRGTPLHDRRLELGLRQSDELGLDISARVGSDIAHVVESLSFGVEEWLSMWELSQELLP